MKLDSRFFFPPHTRLLMAMSLAINTLALALPLMTMQTYDRIMVNHATDTLAMLALGVLVAAMAEMFLRLARSYIVGISGAHFEHHGSVQALTQLLHAQSCSRDEPPPTVLIQDINAASRLKDYYGGQMAATLLVDAPFALVFIGLTFYLVGWLAVLPCAILCCFGYVSWRQGARLKKLMDERERQDNRRYSFIAESLHAVHTLKSLCLEAVTSRHFEEVQRESGEVNFRIAGIQGEAGTLSYAISQIMTVAVVTVGAPLVISNHLSIGMLVAAIMLSGQVMQPMQRGLGLWLKLQDIAVARQRFQSLIARPARTFHVLEELGDNHGTLKMENVRFSYVEGQPVLDGVSLSIHPGETVAIQGSAGCGRTTLLGLLAGIDVPDRGRILVSGMEPHRIPPDLRARYIGYLAENGMILRGSIMDNITGFNPRLRAQAHEMAELLGIEQAVALLPSGYDTPLDGIATDVVPPGLKQRIAMARALLLKPRFILYDSADQGLDRESYARVFDLLARLKRMATLVLVSEDKNILSLADHVFEIRHQTLVPVMEPLPFVAARSIL